MTSSASTASDLETSGVPAAEPRSIYVRAYAPDNAPSRPRDSVDNAASGWVLVFDCETTADVEQKLRFGAYQVRKDGALMEAGLFYEPETIKGGELAALQMDRPAGQALRTLRSFLENVFYKVGHGADGTIVGFNLPFDLSRIAEKAGPARIVRKPGKAGGPDFVDRSMAGGFTFTVAKGRPNVRVKHVSRRSAFMNFAADEEGGDGGGHKRGFFLDLKTLGGALTGQSLSLDRLAVHLGVERKAKFEDFSRDIDGEFIAYAVQDVQTTWLCYEALMQRYRDLGLPTAPTRIYSEASLGKAYLDKMRIKPWREVQPDAPADLIGKIMSAYYGGRAEVHIRRSMVQTRYCDFASMYPTVCSLMDLWSFVTARGFVTADVTEEVHALLGGLTLDQLQAPEFWRGVAVIVEVKPDADIFPARARYGEGPAQTIGLNYVSANRTLWFTLADCIASTLLTGKPPEVVSAVRFSPGAPQDGLAAVTLASGRHEVNPTEEDFYRRVINERRKVKNTLRDAKAKGQPKDVQDRLDAEQLGLKILANATRLRHLYRTEPGRYGRPDPHHHPWRRRGVQNRSSEG